MSSLPASCIHGHACVPKRHFGVQAWANCSSRLRTGEERSWIDQDECVECGVCFRANVCKPQAIYLPELKWPRVVRLASSDPMVEHKETGVRGRGTEERKTMRDIQTRPGSKAVEDPYLRRTACLK